MTSIIIHGHFYQPPRENPWTGAVEREDSARPFHDWNARIHAECYRPNAFARVVNGKGQIERIVNNYASLSFNFGPTLLRWLEVAYPQTSARIVAADQLSRQRHDGHGSAIAQAYNHPILPLCNARDMRTQIRWGVADFRHRFAREPEALWLPETACNDEVMGALIEAGMKYVILSPHQAERVRPLDASGNGGEWKSVADGSIDPRRAYQYFHRDGSGRTIAIFFYDDGIARGIAFENLLWSSEALLERLIRGAGGDGAMVNVATDGESYGHHFKFGDRCLAYALEVEAPKRGIEVTNYGAFLARHPPRDAVEIKAGPAGEGTAWSCVHGVGRWCRNCGCHTGGEAGWNQEWRAPLRTAFDLLRDECASRFEEMGGQLFRDPWKTRDDFIEVILGRASGHDNFLPHHARHKLDGEARLRALTLLEIQRNAMLMYTSCGWFFNDISGLETVQTMKYAAHAMDLMEGIGLRTPRDRFLEVLALGKSNVAEMGTGADIFRRLVTPCRVTPKRLAVHVAISSLVNRSAHEGPVGEYYCREEDFRCEKTGRIGLSTSRVVVRNSILGKRDEFTCATLHLGGIDFFCALKNFTDLEQFRQAGEELWSRFPTASLPTIIRIMQQGFGRDEFGLEEVLPDGRLTICEASFNDLLETFTDQFSSLYEEYNRVVEMLQAAGFQPPPQFRQLTEFTLARRFEHEIARQQGSRDQFAYKGAIEIANFATQRGYQVDKSRANAIFASMINDAVARAVARPSRALANTVLELLALSRRLILELNLEPAQESLYEAFAGGAPHSGQLARLAGAVGLAHSAVRRTKTPRAGAAHDGAMRSQPPPKEGHTPRRRQPRPRAS